jgi:hypothetical protein
MEASVHPTSYRLVLQYTATHRHPLPNILFLRDDVRGVLLRNMVNFKTSAPSEAGARRRRWFQLSFLEPRKPLSSHTPLPGFLRLPFELRLQVYYYLIPTQQVIDVRFPGFRREGFFASIAHPLSETRRSFDVDRISQDRLNYFMFGYKHCNTIFLLSKQISDETLDVLYGENTFKICLSDCGEAYLVKHFAESNRGRMRFLLVTAHPFGSSYTLGPPDNAIWPSIFPALKSLRIVAQQPTLGQGDPAPGVLAPGVSPVQLMNEWIEWFTPFLRCCRLDVVVEVDVNGRADTLRLFAQYLQSYREVRSEEGDFVFKRGPFSPELGYWDSDDFDFVCSL